MLRRRWQSYIHAGCRPLPARCHSRYERPLTLIKRLCQLCNSLINTSGWREYCTRNLSRIFMVLAILRYLGVHLGQFSVVLYQRESSMVFVAHHRTASSTLPPSAPENTYWLFAVRRGHQTLQWRLGVKLCLPPANTLISAQVSGSVRHNVLISSPPHLLHQAAVILINVDAVCQADGLVYLRCIAAR